MDLAFRGDELFVACRGDGPVHVIDVPAARWKASFAAGKGCESLGFFESRWDFYESRGAGVRHSEIASIDWDNII